MGDWNYRMPFGKYNMKHINSVKDLSYLKWFVTKLSNDVQRTNVRLQIKKLEEKQA